MELEFKETANISAQVIHILHLHAEENYSRIGEFILRALLGNMFTSKCGFPMYQGLIHLFLQIKAPEARRGVFGDLTEP